MDGEFINLYIYDIGSKLSYDQVKDLMKNPEDFSKYEYNTPMPEELPTFTLPQVFNLSGSEISIEGKSFKVRVQAAIYAIGAFSIRARIPLENVDESVLSKLAFGKETAMALEQIAEKAHKKIEVALAKQISIKSSNMNEMYSFYFINSTKAQVMKSSKSLVAGLLIDEPAAHELDAEYLNYVLSKGISYNSDDAFFVGWEGAVLIDKLKSFDYELLVAEIANIQLLELRIYKEKASVLLRNTSEAVAQLDRMGFFERMMSSKAERLNHTLAEFSDDLMETLNRIDNTVFSMGEWYLSRIYNMFAGAFRLYDLRNAVIGDSATISNRRISVHEIIEAKRSDILEFIVIVLIVLEIIVEVAFLAKY
ncbi:MAG: hypothetical protein ACP5RF_03265 [Candidatus Micrarchaeia archaeon]